ncbi:MAG: hypothetical protein M1818_003235 [Claussenomyces sp. TS43310]|nr:MAG: hypothetical protein M1818_003235 [Claussenomyces sp. TS43310]
MSLRLESLRGLAPSASGGIQDSSYRVYYVEEIAKRPKDIREDIRPSVLDLLQKYHAAVRLEDVPSAASRTSRGAPTASSATESRSNFQSVFSAEDGADQQADEQNRLPDKLAKRKALLRKMGTCDDCRPRKIKCALEHHALEQLLPANHTEQDKKIIEWAIRTNGNAEAEGHADGAEEPSVDEQPFIVGMTRRRPAADINPVNQILDVTDSNIPFYPPTLEVTDYAPSFGEIPPPEDSASSADSRQNMTIISYNTSRYPDMVLLGFKISWPDRDGRKTYRCCASSACSALFTSAVALQDHSESQHFPFIRLNDPMRMVCGRCNAFASKENSSCPNIDCGELPPLVESVYGLDPHITLFASPQGYVGQGQLTNLMHSAGGPADTTGFNNRSDRNADGSQYAFFDGYNYYQQFRHYSISSIPRLIFGGLGLVRRRLSRRPLSSATTITTIVICSGLVRKHHHLVLAKVLRGIHSLSAIRHLNVPTVGFIAACLAFLLHRLVMHLKQAVRNDMWFTRYLVRSRDDGCRRNEAGAAVESPESVVRSS